MKWLTLTAAMMVCAISANAADAGLFDWHHKDNGCCAPARKCCAPAPKCCKPAPKCCAPAPKCVKPAPKCCAPAPKCCKPAPKCCAPRNDCGCAKGHSWFKRHDDCGNGHGLLGGLFKRNGHGHNYGWGW